MKFIIIEHLCPIRDVIPLSSIERIIFNQFGVTIRTKETPREILVTISSFAEFIDFLKSDDVVFVFEEIEKEEN